MCTLLPNPNRGRQKEQAVSRTSGLFRESMCWGQEHRGQCLFRRSQAQRKANHWGNALRASRVLSPKHPSHSGGWRAHEFRTENIVRWCALQWVRPIRLNPIAYSGGISLPPRLASAGCVAADEAANRQATIPQDCENRMRVRMRDEQNSAMPNAGEQGEGDQRRT